MCNNNGACRALAGGVMCPSYRVTRGNAMSRAGAPIRSALHHRPAGPDAFTSDEMAETMKLCVSCKACRRECPTGVDMARMKIEVGRRTRRQARTLAARSVGWLSSALCALCGARAVAAELARHAAAAAKLSEAIAGFSARRSLPRWRADWFRGSDARPLPAKTGVRP